MINYLNRCRSALRRPPAAGPPVPGRDPVHTAGSAAQLVAATADLSVRVPEPDRAYVVLLSDCVRNAGPDPRSEAARLPRLDVLLDVSGEQDVDLARQLARSGHGTLARIRTYRDVAPALSRAFAD